MGNEERRIKNVAEYRQELLAIAERWRSPVIAFRGQEDKRWLLESSAERRLKKGLKGQGRIPDSLFIEYHRDNLVQKGKLRNYDKREGKQLAELELLANLQHHGAATCLLDFTRNALVALWFACENSHGESGAFDQETAEGLGESHKVFSDGKVFVVNTADERGGFQEVTPRDIAGKSIEDMLKFKTRDEDPARERTDQDSLEPSSDKAKFWYWTPAHLNERITAQDSLFLFAPPSSGKPSSEDIVVAAGCKGQIRKELETLYNTHEESLFPDFVGFAYTQRHDAPVDILDSEEYRRRGIEAAQRGEQQQAIEHYTKAIGIQPDDGDTYFRRGQVYDETGSHDLAIQDFDKALALRPDDAFTHALRGTAYYHNSELDLAIQDFDKALALDPDYAFAYFLRGTAYYRKGEFDLAIQALDKELALDPDDAFAYVLRGSAHYGKGGFNLAIQDFDKALALDPDYAITYALRGAAHYGKGGFDFAIQDFDKALALDPDDSNSYFSRSLVWLSMSKWTNAESDLTYARSKGHDITRKFSDMGWSVEDFEQKHEVKLPPVIASMLSTKPESTV